MAPALFRFTPWNPDAGSSFFSGFLADCGFASSRFASTWSRSHAIFTLSGSVTAAVAGAAAGARALGAGAGAPSDAEISRATSGAFGDEPGPEAGGASAEDIARGAERGGRNAGGPARERASRGVRGARAWHSRESHAAKEQHLATT